MNKGKQKQELAPLPIRAKPDIVKTYIESKAKAEDRREMGSESEVEEYVLKAFNEFTVEESVQAIKRSISGAAGPKDMTADYRRWKEFFDKEMNVCLFGVGSKKRIMDEFVELHYRDCMQVRIKGYNASVKVDNVFMKLLQALEVFADCETKAEVQKVLGMKKHKSTATVDVLTKLLANFERYGQTLVVLFYDIDGKNFRELESHAYLSKVFKCRPSVKLLASFSNSNFPYLFNKDVWINYNFTFYPTHTYELYEHELANDEIYWFNKKQMKGSNAIKVIYKSLTDTQKEVLKLLSEKICQSPSLEVEYKHFYEECLEEMIVSGESQLKDSLSEAIAHNLVIEKTNENGKKMLKMPNAHEALAIFSKDDWEDEEEG